MEKTASGMLYDLNEFRDTAKVLIIINPYITDWSVDDLVENMIRTADSVFKELSQDMGYVAILGYMLTAYRSISNNGKLAIRSSVCTHTIAKHLNILQGSSLDKRTVP